MFIDYANVRKVASPRGNFHRNMAPVSFGTWVQRRGTKSERRHYRFSLSAEAINACGLSYGDRINLLYDPGLRAVRLVKVGEGDWGHQLTICDKKRGDKSRATVTYVADPSIPLPQWDVPCPVEEYVALNRTHGVAAGIEFRLPADR